MTSAIELVARAICREQDSPACWCKRNGAPCRAPLDELIDPHNEFSRQARAVIEALPTADAIEEWLRTAAFEKVKAVHDLCHAAMSDRFSQGVKPQQRTLKKARKAIDGRPA